jgi:outer membrane protein assembly factor BamB
VPVFFDGTCREALVRDFEPLGTSFDRFEKDTHPASDDAAYWRFPRYVRGHLEALKKTLGAAVAPLADVPNEEILLSERTSEEGRYLFAVNNTTPDLDPGQIWRVTLSVASRVPVKAALRLGQGHIYDVFGLKKVEVPDGLVQADLRSLPARIFAVLPAPIARVDLAAPEAARPGEALAWKVRVLDDAGRPIRAAIPVQVKLSTADGRLLALRGVSAGSQGVSGEFVVPLNAGPVTLEATELFSGKSARGPAAQPSEDAFGPHLRDVALVKNGSLAVFNAMNWDHNLYAVDVETGELRWRERAGNYFAFAPQTAGSGFLVQGFRFEAAEGYHLYLGNSEGKLERRFGLYGLPGRLPHRFVPGILRDRIDQFAAPDDGSWIASAGDLGVAVWSRQGQLLWTEDAWKTARRAQLVAALDSGTLLVADGMKVSARDARSGRLAWTVTLASTGEAREIKVSRDRKTVAVLTTTEGGRLFILREGKIQASHATGGGNAIDVSADGGTVAVATGNLLKVFSSAGGLRWTLGGDDFMRFPRISPDGERLAATTDLGTLYVARTEGAVLLERDLGAVSVPCWLKGGDLLLGSWMGRVSRLDGQYRERWSTRLSPSETDLRRKILTDDPTPLARVTQWINAEPASLPLTPNLLSEKEVRITFVAQQNHIQFVRPTAALVDGKGEPPSEPWLHWGDVGSFAETSPFNTILIDTFRTKLRVTGITLAEDPRHPESWLRDVTLEGWNAQKEQWELSQELRSDSAVHTHRLKTPIESARFRLVLPWGVCGNIRLAQIVLHGERLGSAHPDVAARKPLAVLFDEGDDLKGYLVWGPLAFRFEGAYSGGRCLALQADQKAYAPFQPPFGHVLPNWDFEIAEHPEPGQYRYLQFAWRALSKEAQGITLGLWGANYGEKLLCHSGKLTPEEGSIPKKISDAPPREWETVRLDLWEIYKKPVRIRSMSAGCQGGPVAFDQIVLGRREADLPSSK